MRVWLVERHEKEVIMYDWMRTEIDSCVVKEYYKPHSGLGLTQLVRFRIVLLSQ